MHEKIAVVLQCVSIAVPRPQAVTRPRLRFKITVIEYKDRIGTILTNLFDNVMRLETDDDANILRLSEKFQLPADQGFPVDVDQSLRRPQPQTRADARAAYNN